MNAIKREEVGMVIASEPEIAPVVGVGRSDRRLTLPSDALPQSNNSIPSLSTCIMKRRLEHLYVCTYLRNY